MRVSYDSVIIFQFDKDIFKIEMYVIKYVFILKSDSDSDVILINNLDSFVVLRLEKLFLYDEAFRRKNRIEKGFFLEIFFE